MQRPKNQATNSGGDSRARTDLVFNKLGFSKPKCYSIGFDDETLKNDETMPTSAPSAPSSSAIQRKPRLFDDEPSDEEIDFHLPFFERCIKETMQTASKPESDDDDDVIFLDGNDEEMDQISASKSSSSTTKQTSQVLSATSASTSTTSAKKGRQSKQGQTIIEDSSEEEEAELVKSEWTSASSSKANPSSKCLEQPVAKRTRSKSSNIESPASSAPVFSSTPKRKASTKKRRQSKYKRISIADSSEEEEAGLDKSECSPSATQPDDPPCYSSSSASTSTTSANGSATRKRRKNNLLDSTDEDSSADEVSPAKVTRISSGNAKKSNTPALTKASPSGKCLEQPSSASMHSLQCSSSDEDTFCEYEDSENSCTEDEETEDWSDDDEETSYCDKSKEEDGKDDFDGSGDESGSDENLNDGESDEEVELGTAKGHCSSSATKRQPVEHLFEHVKGWQYSCKLCGQLAYYYNGKYQHLLYLDRHFKKHHDERGTKILKGLTHYTCTSGANKGKVYPLTGNLPPRVYPPSSSANDRSPVEHLFEHTEGWQYRCKMCAQLTQYYNVKGKHSLNMERHFKKHHDKRGVKVLNGLTHYTCTSGANKGKVYPLTGKLPPRVIPPSSSATNRQPIEHLFEHVDGWQYSCKLCSRTTFYSTVKGDHLANLNRHFTNNHDERGTKILKGLTHYTCTNGENKGKVYPLTGNLPPRIFPPTFSARPRQRGRPKKVLRFKVRRSPLYRRLVSHESTAHSTDTGTDTNRDITASNQSLTSEELITTFAIFHHSLLQCLTSNEYHQSMIDKMKNLLEAVSANDHTDEKYSVYVHHLSSKSSSPIDFLSKLTYVGYTGRSEGIRAENHFRAAEQAIRERLRPEDTLSTVQLTHHLMAECSRNGQSITIQTVTRKLKKKAANLLEHALIMFAIAHQMNANETHGTTTLFKKMRNRLTQDELATCGAAWLLDFLTSGNKSKFSSFSAGTQHLQKITKFLRGYRAEQLHPISMISLADEETLPDFSLVDGKISKRNLVEYGVRLFLALFTIAPKISYWWLTMPDSKEHMDAVKRSCIARWTEFREAISAILFNRPTSTKDCVNWAEQLFVLIFSTNPKLANDKLEKQGKEARRYPIDPRGQNCKKPIRRFITSAALLRAHIYSIDTTEEKVLKIFNSAARPEPEQLFPLRPETTDVVKTFADLPNSAFPLPHQELSEDPETYSAQKLIRPIELFMDDDVVCQFVDATAKLRGHNYFRTSEYLKNSLKNVKIGSAYFRCSPYFPQFI